MLITVYSDYQGMPVLQTSYKVLSSILISGLRKFMGDHCVDFDATHQLLIKLFAHEKNASTATLAIYRLQKDYDLIRREVFYTILIEFGVPMKVVLSVSYTFYIGFGL
jgi:hypothetical protein